MPHWALGALTTELRQLLFVKSPMIGFEPMFPALMHSDVLSR